MLNKTDFRTFHRRLYAGFNESVKLYKRNDDLQQGVVTTYTLYDCRWSMVYRTGETLEGDLLAGNHRQLHVPVVEMEANGINYINPLDRFEDEEGRVWQPEATTMMVSKLKECHFCISCLQVEGRSLHG